MRIRCRSKAYLAGLPLAGQTTDTGFLEVHPGDGDIGRTYDCIEPGLEACTSWIGLIRQSRHVLLGVVRCWSASGSSLGVVDGIPRGRWTWSGPGGLRDLT